MGVGQVLDGVWKVMCVTGLGCVWDAFLDVLDLF